MMTKRCFTAAAFLIALALSACNSGDPASAPLLAGAGVHSAGPSASHTLWGFWTVTLDRQTAEFEVVPLRHTAFQANVTQFLQPPFSPTNLLSLAIDIGQSNLNNGYVVCTVTLRHPFPSLPQYRGFDVRGICMGDGSLAGKSGDGELWPGQSDLRVLNADGYTRWWNPTEFTTYNTIFGYTKGKLAPASYLASATLNAYKYFADGLAPDASLDALDLNMRGTYSVSPGINARKYMIQFPVVGSVPQYKFNYAVTASYVEPDPSGAPSYPLESFPLSANLPEAFNIVVTDNGSTAYYKNSGSFGGDLKAKIEVFDWGFGTSSEVTDEVAGITIESPTLFDGQVSVDLGTAEAGSTPYSRLFSVTVPNVTPTAQTGQELLVRVLCANPTSYAPDIPGISGFVYPQNAPLASYCLWTVPIKSEPAENTPPQVGTIDGPSSTVQNQNESYTLSYATDAEDGTNLTILWDNDGDSDFNDDLDGNNKDLHATLKWTSQGTFSVVARAVDSGGLYTNSAPYQVQVTYCPTQIHNSFQSYSLGGAPGTQLLRMDSAFQVKGSHAGRLICPLNQTELRSFDTSAASPWPGQSYITLQGADSSTIVASIDIDDYSGRVIVAGRSNNWQPDQFQVYSSSGSYLGTVSVGAGRWISAIDTDKKGDVWVATCQYAWPVTNQKTWLQHFEYKDSAPYYVEDPADQLETKAQVDQVCNVWDIAVAYSLNRLYLFHGNYNNGPAPYGEIFAYDIAADGKLTYNDSIKNLKVFPDKVAGAYMDNAGWCTYGKIDIDHASEASDGCRIIVMARWASNMQYFYLGLMDSNLNMIDLKSQVFPTMPYAFSIGTDPNPALRRLVCTGYSTGLIYKSEAPPGW